MNDDLKMTWKEEVVAKYKVLSRHLPGGADKPSNTSARIAGLWAEIWIRDLPGTKQEC
jgi:hypothetical protein